MEEELAIDLAEVRRDVEAAFAAYETALVANDLAALDDFFWRDHRTIRYGIAENLYGHDEIAAYRRATAPPPPDRRLERTEITTFGRNAATCMTLFRSGSQPDRIGRQSQSWVRFAEGWKIVAAHVSLVRLSEIGASGAGRGMEGAACPAVGTAEADRERAHPTPHSSMPTPLA